MKLKTFGIILAWLTAVGFACASTNDITTLVQKGLFEEEANHHLDAATEYYQEAIGKFDKDRQLTATAIFHLGECYRLQGKTNEANVQYQRIVREFPDQTQLVDLSKGYLPKEMARSTFSQNLTRITGGNPGGFVVAGGQAELRSPEEQAEIRQIKDIIQNSPDLINAPPPRLVAAAGNGWMSAAQLLVSVGANVNPVLANGNKTPLTAAAAAGNKAMVELLLSHDANINAVDRSSRLAPLHYAVYHGFKAVAETLLAYGADVDVPDGQGGDRPLHIAVDKGYIKLVELLLAHKANVNAPGTYEKTPLFGAIRGNDIDMVQLLISNKANVNIRAVSGETPLLAAADQPGIHLAIVKVLLDSGADVDATAKMGLYLSGQPLSHIVTPLILAISRSSEGKTAAFLLEHSANPNIADETGETPLDYAIVYGVTNLIEDLIAHHADVNAPDKKGEPPLAYASRLGGELKEKIKQMLIQAGANEDYQRRGAIFITQKGTGSIGSKVFSRAANAANRYTLFELIAKAYGGEPGRFGPFGVNSPGVAFPDLAHVSIDRLKANGSKEEITVDLKEILQSGDCSKNPWLEWGDIVLIPQLDHNVNDGWRGLSQPERDTLGKCLLRKVKLVVKGQTTQLALLPSIVQTYSYTAAGAGGIVGETWFQSGPGPLSPTLTSALNGESILSSYDLNEVVHEANVLLISSDLSRVKVTRSEAEAAGHPQVMEFNLETQPPPAVPLLDGDVIEIPEREQK